MRESRGLRGLKVRKGPKVRWVLKGSRAQKARLALKGSRGQKAIQGLQEHADLKEFRDQRGMQALRDRVAFPPLFVGK